MGTSEGHQGSAHLAEDDNVPLDIIPSGVQVVHQRIHPTQPSVLCRREGIVSVGDDDAIKSQSSRNQVAIKSHSSRIQVAFKSQSVPVQARGYRVRR